MKKKQINNTKFHLISKLSKQILRHEDDEALLRAYINVWTKFLDQSNYLPYPFSSMEQNPSSKSNSTAVINNTAAIGGGGGQLGQQARKTPDSHVRKLMLDTWSKSIFSEIKHRLQNSAMKIVYAERIGEPFDSQLVIGVRESYGNKIKINHLNKFEIRKRFLYS